MKKKHIPLICYNLLSTWSWKRYELKRYALNLKKAPTYSASSMSANFMELNFAVLSDEVCILSINWIISSM